MRESEFCLKYFISSFFHCIPPVPISKAVDAAVTRPRPILPCENENVVFIPRAFDTHFLGNRNEKGIKRSKVRVEVNIIKTPGR